MLFSKFLNDHLSLNDDLLILIPDDLFLLDMFFDSLDLFFLFVDDFGNRFNLFGVCLDSSLFIQNINFELSSLDFYAMNRVSIVVDCSCNFFLLIKIFFSFFDEFLDLLFLLIFLFPEGFTDFGFSANFLIDIFDFLFHPNYLYFKILSTFRIVIRWIFNFKFSFLQFLLFFTKLFYFYFVVIYFLHVFFQYLLRVLNVCLCLIIEAFGLLDIWVIFISNWKHFSFCHLNIIFHLLFSVCHFFC